MFLKVVIIRNKMIMPSKVGDPVFYRAQFDRRIIL